jgi:hypothetical protein
MVIKTGQHGLGNDILFILSSMSALQVKIVPLPDAHQPQMLFARTLTYSELETFALIICYNMLYIAAITIIITTIL